VLVFNRLVFLSVVLVAIPAVSQRGNVQARINQSIAQHQQQLSQVPPAPEPNLRAARVQAVHQDASELSALSASMQSDLQKLQKGMLVKDLSENLKKMEKLSKRLRREIE
jgi:hypothetical protein